MLLRGKYLVTFLRLHGREVFTEIRAAYVDTLSRVLSSHFRAYLAAIERLQVWLLLVLPPMYISGGSLPRVMAERPPAFAGIRYLACASLGRLSPPNALLKLA